MKQLFLRIKLERTESKGFNTRERSRNRLLEDINVFLTKNRSNQHFTKKEQFGKTE
jgi:hypothetical protein